MGAHQIDAVEHSRMLSNLGKTCELIDLAYRLKEAYFMSQNPLSTTRDAVVAINSQMLMRKDRQWTSLKD